MSNSNIYQLYVDKVLQLARTIVVKSELTATAQNKFVTDYYGPAAVDTVNPQSWKYYLNLSGEYHPVDTPMFVVSMDTRENILFSKQNLEIHRATKRGYAFGSRPYEALVAQYPTQETLIKGILYPVDIDEAVAAPEGKILGYPSDLVEANEYSLIAKLQGWIDRFYIRWVNKQFTLSDDLYAATYLGLMYLNMVPAIMTFRLEACKTNEAHSFHVRQYLASHGFLDKFMDQMTTEQTLFFYRNIAFIERNVGKCDTFEWLVEHIMTQRSLPLSEFVMRHDLQKLPTKLYPELTFERNPLNDAYSGKAQDAITLEELLDKENPLARDNSQLKDDYEPVVQEQMENSLSGVVLTKVLESALVDYSNPGPNTFEDVLMSHWLYLSARDKYLAFVNITNPKTGEVLPFTVKEAYIFVWYAFSKSIGFELTKVPQILAKRVQRIETPPTAQQLLNIADKKLLTLADAQQVIATRPTIGSLLSTDAFYDTCVEVHAAMHTQRKLVASTQHHEKRAMMQSMVNLMYCDRVCTLAPTNTTYEAWFAQQGIKIDDLSLSQLAAMYLETVQKATGMDLHKTTSLQELQAAMTRMLVQLSSYSVQVITDINFANIHNLDWTAVRVGKISGSAGGHQYVPDASAEIIDVKASVGAYAECDMNQVTPMAVIGHNSTQRSVYDIGLDVDYKAQVMYKPAELQVATVGPSAPLNYQGPDVFGIQTYLDLTVEQQQQLQDMYQPGYDTIAPLPASPLSGAITDPNLDGISPNE